MTRADKLGHPCVSDHLKGSSSLVHGEYSHVPTFPTRRRGPHIWHRARLGPLSRGEAYKSRFGTAKRISCPCNSIELGARRSARSGSLMDSTQRRERPGEPEPSSRRFGDTSG